MITGYVQTLCQQLVAHAKQFPTNYEVFVLDSATVNAMTTPGYIFVYRGILNAAKTEDELAGVLAHEIGHSVAHHVAKAQTKQALDQQQVEKLKQSNSKFSQFLAKMLEAGNPLGQLTFSRENEAQADRLGRAHRLRRRLQSGRSGRHVPHVRVDVTVVAQRLGPDDAHAPVLDRSRERRDRLQLPAAGASRRGPRPRRLPR